MTTPPYPRHSSTGRIAIGFVCWLFLTTAAEWLPVLWSNGWQPPTPLVAFSVLLLALVVVALNLLWWMWFGSLRAVPPRIRVMVVAAGALAVTIGAGLIEYIQSFGWYPVTVDDTPPIFSLVVAPVALVWLSGIFGTLATIGYGIGKRGSWYCPRVGRTGLEPVTDGL